MTRVKNSTVTGHCSIDVSCYVCPCLHLGTALHTVSHLYSLALMLLSLDHSLPITYLILGILSDLVQVTSRSVFFSLPCKPLQWHHTPPAEGAAAVTLTPASTGLTQGRRSTHFTGAPVSSLGSISEPGLDTSGIHFHQHPHKHIGLKL